MITFVQSLPNWQKLLILLLVGVVLASIPQTGRAAVIYMIILALFLAIATVSGQSLEWDGTT